MDGAVQSCIPLVPKIKKLDPNLLNKSNWKEIEHIIEHF